MAYILIQLFLYMIIGYVSDRFFSMRFYAQILLWAVCLILCTVLMIVNIAKEFTGKKRVPAIVLAAAAMGVYTLFRILYKPQYYANDPLWGTVVSNEYTWICNLLSSLSSVASLITVTASLIRVIKTDSPEE